MEAKKNKEIKTFLSHPRGLLGLFQLELWERFSYAGFSAILVLYLTDTVVRGGLAFDVETASSLSSVYFSLIYLLTIGGAFLADRFYGTYRSVLWGGIIITSGHICMAIPGLFFTFMGLGLIILGTSFLKPNISTMVGELYDAGDLRRDAGFAIYYTGINIGYFLGGFIVGFVGQKFSYHKGFSIAAVGMIIGLLIYVIQKVYYSKASFSKRLVFKWTKQSLFISSLIIIVIICSIVFSISTNNALKMLINIISFITMAVPIMFFIFMYRSSKVTQSERINLIPFAFLWFASVLINMLGFQIGNTLNLLAKDLGNTFIMGYEFPSTWYGTLMALVSIIVGPVIAILWMKMGAKQPFVSTKVGLGALITGFGFIVIALGTSFKIPIEFNGMVVYKIASLYFIFLYIFLAIGDVLLQTSGLSATTKLAPAAFASQTMALWFLAIALSGGIQAQVVKFYGSTEHWIYFSIQGILVCTYGLLLIFCAPYFKKIMKGV